jgi:hypothetical protein
MKKNRRTKASTESLVPTGALHPFYDPQQFETKEPRKDSFEVVFKGALQQRVSDGAKKITCACADVTTKELQNWIDLFTAEILRRALAGEDDAIKNLRVETRQPCWLAGTTDSEAKREG